MSTHGSNTNASQASPYETASHTGSVVYLVIIGVLGTLGNSLVIFVIWRYPKLRTATNLFILNLAFCDLVMSILDNTFSIVSTWHHRWMFGKSGCLGYGFLYYFFISNTVSTLAAISVDRFFYITKPGQIKAWRITRTRAGMMLLVIYIYVLLFTFPPLAGWSSFIEEADFFSGCYINYGDQNPAAIAYSVIASIFLYLVPLVVMICCYSRIFSAVRTSTHRTMNRSAPSVHGTIRRKYPILKRTHVQTAKMIVLVILFSMIVWVPYVVVSLIKAFTGNSIISPLASHVTVLVAKSCVIYNVLIYVVLNRKLKAVIMNLICCGRDVSFIGSNKTSESKLRISRILSETDREIAPEAVRNRLSALQEQNESGSNLSLSKPSPILRYSTEIPDLHEIETPRSTKLRNGHAKTVEFKVDMGYGKNLHEATSDETTGSEASSRTRIKRRKLPKIQRGLQENHTVENGVSRPSMGANQNGKNGGKIDPFTCSDSSRRNSHSGASSSGKLLLTETVTRAEARRKAIRRMSHGAANYSDKARDSKLSMGAGGIELDMDECNDVFESPRFEKQDSRDTFKELESEQHSGGINYRSREELLASTDGTNVRSKDFEFRNNITINHHRGDSSSTAVPSSPASTVSNRSSACEDSSTGVPTARRSLTSPRHKHGPRRTRKKAHRERNASLRARLNRSRIDVMQASPTELHEIQNYWKRMSLCLDEIDLDEMV